MLSRNPEKILIEKVRELKQQSVLNKKSDTVIAKEIQEAIDAWIHKCGFKPERVITLLCNLLEIKLKEGIFKDVKLDALLQGRLPKTVKDVLESKVSNWDIFLIESLAQHFDRSGNTHFYLEPKLRAVPGGLALGDILPPDYSSTALMMTNIPAPSAPPYPLDQQQIISVPMTEVCMQQQRDDMIARQKARTAQARLQAEQDRIRDQQVHAHDLEYKDTLNDDVAQKRSDAVKKRQDGQFFQQQEIERQTIFATTQIDTKHQLQQMDKRQTQLDSMQQQSQSLVTQAFTR